MTERRAKAVTRAEVAQLAGVSSAVVSYVVNRGPRPVAAETEARVRAAIDMLGYQPNATARALKLGTTGVLGLVVPDSSNPFYAEFGLEIERVATDNGRALLVASSNSDPVLEARLISDMSGRQLDGLLVAGFAGPVPGVSTTARTSIPIVYLDSQVPVPGHTTLCSDAQAGATMLTDHLVQQHGHRSVALVMGTSSQPWRDGREVGWELSMRSIGNKSAPILRVPFTRRGGYEAGRKLLSRRRRPTAVLASSDLQAVGLLRAAHELGLRIPEDVAVVAYDGTAEAEFSWPGLTCAHQRVGEIAEAAVRALIDREPAAHRVFDVDLTLRRSCGCS